MASDGPHQNQSSEVDEISRISTDEELPDHYSYQRDFQTFQNLMRDLFPHGHPAFKELTIEQLALHSKKNEGYAGGGAPLGNFERVADIMKLYPNFPYQSHMGVLVMYYMKHFDRVMWDLCHGKFPSDESLADMAVYATILRCMQR